MAVHAQHPAHNMRRVCASIMIVLLACAASVGGSDGDECAHYTRGMFEACVRVLCKLPHKQFGGLRNMRQTMWTHQGRIRDLEAVISRNGEPKVEEAWALEEPLDAARQRLEQLKANQTELQQRFDADIKQLQDQQLLPANLNASQLSACLSVQLNPRHFPDQPIVSFLLQYYKRPNTVAKHVQRLSTCQAVIASELLVNVDSGTELVQWGSLAYNTSGFVVPVFSHNLHEVRAFNRLAGMARGDVLVMLQDDEYVPQSCDWVQRVVSQFSVHPKLAAVGMRTWRPCDGRQVMPAYDPRAFKDPLTGQTFNFAVNVDFAPLAIRAVALRAVGGVDESLGEVHQCGIWSDWELSYRFWMAGWQVGVMPRPEGMEGDGQPGGTHVGSAGERCWVRQQGRAMDIVRSRYLALEEDLCELVWRTQVATLQLQPSAVCPFNNSGCSSPAVPFQRR